MTHRNWSSGFKLNSRTLEFISSEVERKLYIIRQQWVWDVSVWKLRELHQCLEVNVSVVQPSGISLWWLFVVLTYILRPHAKLYDEALCFASVDGVLVEPRHRAAPHQLRRIFGSVEAPSTRLVCVFFRRYASLCSHLFVFYHIFKSIWGRFVSILVAF